MANIHQALKNRQGNRTGEEWAAEISAAVGEELKPPTLYAFMSGRRIIQGKGAKILAQYFHSIGDTEMVNLLSEETLGLPFGSSNGG